MGGIAGTNSGAITGCTASGVVRGTQYTGGIAGQNSGTLLRCENTAAVNTTVSDADLASAGISGLENTFYSILKKEDTAENAITTDTGGIAGFSTGIVQSCTNAGSVGYPHVGYNVGGIAGRQSGYMASCVNRGEIQGRKDVGGIVGQMVPDITLQFSDNGLDELQTELNTLQSLITTLASDTQRDGHAEVLVEGRFRDGDSLRVEKNALLVPGQEEQMNTWTLEIPDDGQSSHTVRWRIPSDGARTYTIYTMQSDGWHKVHNERIGGYLCFTLDGNGQFAVAPTEPAAWWIWALAGVGCAGAAGVILLSVHKRKGGKQPL